MAVQISGDIVRAAQAADSDPKIVLVLIAFGSYVADLDYGAMSSTIRSRLASGTTLWEATEQWKDVRSEACALLREMQATGFEETAGEGVPLGAFVFGVLLVWLMVKKRR